MIARPRSWSLLLICFLLSGCGAGDWGTVAGTVTLDGEPLKEGVVTFHAANEASGYGQVKDGAFTVYTGQKPGLRAGKYQVTVSATTVPPSGSAQQAKLLTPKKYALKETSGLTADVKPGANAVKLEMQSKS